jgi:hypothetical protein
MNLLSLRATSKGAEMALFKRKNPEDADLLLQLNPARTYTRNEVNQVMALISGAIFDGLPIKEWEVVEETPHWFKVQVTFDNYLDPNNDDYETWYFYKTDETASST